MLLVGIGIGVMINRTIELDAADPHAQAAESDTHAGHGRGSEAEAHSTELADWCAEHRVPESECTLCNPGLAETFKASGQLVRRTQSPESHCRRCDPFLTFPQEPNEPITAEPVTASVFFPPNDGGCHSDEAVIRFASVETPRPDRPHRRTGRSVDRIRPG